MAQTVQFGQITPTLLKLMHRFMVGQQQAVRGADTLGHRLVDAVTRLEYRFLRHITQAQARLAPDLAGIGLNLAGDDAQQARFAGSVAPDQANPLALVHDQGCVVQQRPVTIGKFEFVEYEKRHGCMRPAVLTAILKDSLRFYSEPCSAPPCVLSYFSWQAMQRTAAGFATRRAAGMALPQSGQTPKSSPSMRS